MQHQVYQLRRDSLRKLGFASYSDYLASPLWKRIRLLALQANKGRCLLCGCRANQVHHRAYGHDVLSGQPEAVRRDLIAICDYCHGTVEKGADGRLDATGKEARLAVLLAAANHTPPPSKLDKSARREWVAKRAREGEARAVALGLISDPKLSPKRIRQSEKKQKFERAGQQLRRCPKCCVERPLSQFRKIARSRKYKAVTQCNECLRNRKPWVRNPAHAVARKSGADRAGRCGLGGGHTPLNGPALTG